MIPARSYCAVTHTHTHTLLASMISHEHQNRFEELIPMFGVCDECSFPHVDVGSDVLGVEVIVCPVIALFAPPPLSISVWLKDLVKLENIKYNIRGGGGVFKKKMATMYHIL